MSDEETEREAAIAAELREILTPEAPETEVSPEVLPEFEEVDRRSLRFYCAGARRINEVTGKATCDYRARNRWYTRCPKCGRLYACLLIPRNPRKEEFRKTIVLNHKTMAAAQGLVHHSTGIPELDRVLGGGVVCGTTLLFGGSRGSGKSTITMQACAGFVGGEGRPKACFASAEMPEMLLLAYAKRLGLATSKIKLVVDPQGLDVDKLFEDVLAFGASLLVLDSLQTAYVADKKGDLGNPSMVEAVTNMVTSFAAAKGVAVFLIGHLGKLGDYAGSERVQHLVDGLLRMDVKYIGVDGFGKPIDSMVRQLSMDSKSRIGRSDVTSLVELTDDGIAPLSVAGARRIR